MICSLQASVLCIHLLMGRGKIVRIEVGDVWDPRYRRGKRNRVTINGPYEQKLLQRLISFGLYELNVVDASIVPAKDQSFPHEAMPNGILLAKKLFDRLLD